LNACYLFVPTGGHLEAARLLLSRGVDVDPIDYRGTPLHLAAGKGGNDQVVKLLLEHGADVS
jgi:ankyrin repeat protein